MPDNLAHSEIWIFRIFIPLPPPRKSRMRRTRSASPDEDDAERPYKQVKMITSVPTQTEPELKSLLDLSNIEAHGFEPRFRQIAETLIHRSRLEVTANEEVQTYQVMELEFYLLDPNLHWDPFTHGEEEQKVSGRWYVGVRSSH